MADDGDIYYVEHSQVGRVRIIAHADTVEAAWYDYNGDSSNKSRMSMMGR